MIQTTITRTGKIYCDKNRHLEWLYVGDYGKENNIKADFLGLNKKIDGVKHTNVDITDKMVVTISTQKGCPMLCDFCDAPKVGFYGNASTIDMLYMINHALIDSKAQFAKRLNVHFARIGEPTFNRAVLETAAIIWSLKFNIPEIRDINLTHNFITETVHPVLSTMLPHDNTDLESYLIDWCLLKNRYYQGEAGLQLSINSTCEKQRNNSFNHTSLSLDEISKLCKRLPSPLGRKYTLNFAVTQETILCAEKLNNLFDKEKFIVKITPIHQTKNAIQNNYDVSTTYDKYDVYSKFEEPLLELGWDVIVFVPSKEEDEDRITCGNALLSD